MEKTEYELNKEIVMKAMAYDLICLIKANACKQEYEAKEIIALIRSYVADETNK